MRRIAIIALVLVALAGCKKSKEEPGGAEGGGSGSEPPPTPISASEADTGRKACAAYVEHVCDCALKLPELAEKCDLAGAQPDALEMNLRAAMAEGNATSEDRRALLANTRKIVRACIEQSAALAAKGCPMDPPEQPEPTEPEPAPPPPK